MICVVFTYFFPRTLCPGRPASPGSPGTPWQWRHSASDHVTVDGFKLFDKRFKYDYAAAAANSLGKAPQPTPKKIWFNLTPVITAYYGARSSDRAEQQPKKP